MTEILSPYFFTPDNNQLLSDIDELEELVMTNEIPDRDALILRLALLVTRAEMGWYDNCI